MTEITPLQLEANRARQRRAREAHLDGLRHNLRELQQRLDNAIAHQSDPMRAATIEPLRERVASQDRVVKDTIVHHARIEASYREGANEAQRS